MSMGDVKSGPASWPRQGTHMRLPMPHEENIDPQLMQQRCVRDDVPGLRYPGRAAYCRLLGSRTMPSVRALFLIASADRPNRLAM